MLDTIEPTVYTYLLFEFNVYNIRLVFRGIRTSSTAVTVVCSQFYSYFMINTSEIPNRQHAWMKFSTFLRHFANDNFGLKNKINASFLIWACSAKATPSVNKKKHTTANDGTWMICMALGNI